MIPIQSPGSKPFSSHLFALLIGRVGSQAKNKRNTILPLHTNIEWNQVKKVKCTAKFTPVEALYPSPQPAALCFLDSGCEHLLCYTQLSTFRKHAGNKISCGRIFDHPMKVSSLPSTFSYGRWVLDSRCPVENRDQGLSVLHLPVAPRHPRASQQMGEFGSLSFLRAYARAHACGCVYIVIVYSGEVALPLAKQ